MVEAIHSGAQTGADIAGLDVGVFLELRTGGWVPYGRRTDAGPLSDAAMKLYNLKEHASAAYPPRTEQNVKETGGTVIFGKPDSPGCSLTIRLCQRYHRPYLIMQDVNYSAADLRQWLRINSIKILNVAGNRERTNPGIYRLTFDTLLEALS